MVVPFLPSYPQGLVSELEYRPPTNNPWIGVESPSWRCHGFSISTSSSTILFKPLAGLVNSGFFMSLLQWAGRSHVLFCIICQIEEIEKTSFVFMVFTAWSLSEVIRYPQYVLYMLGACPTWLTWIRYTAFIPLYPVGILGEVVSMYMALPYIQRSNLYGNLFELLPFGYYSLTTVLIAIYPFLWMPLYMHMFKRRHNKLTNSSMTRKKTAIKKS
ncbi:hypothetical protein O6H91_16G069200 [Diphasiastrum complanatum]|uniref:Uncharacterized protein n=1 Tax=Diphasiastrum complanatum TaxID=34168 RepID=A0ACC2BD45_DIPCM|nr:hypothetical protein O6H91_16G069200 [Diphasiastrum complanatum]